MSRLNRPARAQRGLSLVELMVGITVGLFVVAAAATLVSLQLSDNRRLTLETQVQQDLRASADIIARDVRRAGIRAGANGTQLVAWRPGDDAHSAGNANYDVSPAVPDVEAEEVTYKLARPGSSGPWGFRLNGDVIEAKYVGIGAGWQPLTDPTTMRVTRFKISPRNEPPIQMTCQKKCADDTQDCWPQLQVRAFQIEIEGVATSDANVRRSVQQLVHLRNDAVVFQAPDDTRSCPP